MHHVAIMKPAWKLIPKILSGQKTMESRWYQTRRAPWDQVQSGDMVYFKNAGEPVVASATIAEVFQFEIASADDARKIMDRFGRELLLVQPDPATWSRLPRYCILIRLQDPKVVDPPFQINKHGFGSAAAWITVSDIEAIRVQ